jgi:hypothetical protein
VTLAYSVLVNVRSSFFVFFEASSGDLESDLGLLSLLMMNFSICIFMIIAMSFLKIWVLMRLVISSSLS